MNLPSTPAPKLLPSVFLMWGIICKQNKNRWKRYSAAASN